MEDRSTSRDNVGKFGPAILGEEEYERQQEALEKAGGEMSKFGPRVMNAWNPDGEDAEGASEALQAADEDRKTPIDALEEALAELPVEYSVEGGQGGYYTLYGPDGELIPGPTSSDKWGPGPGEVLDAARKDYERRVKQEESDEQAGPEEQLSVDEVRGVLDSDPDKIDRLMHMEYRRAEGPRLEVIRLMREVEEEREDTRPEVVSTLQETEADLSTSEETEG